MLNLRQQKGFLLVEIVIAIIIITTALLAAIEMFIQSTKANVLAGEYTAAVALAQKAMERLKVQDSHFWQENCPSNNIVFPDETLPVTVNGIQYNILALADDYPVQGSETTICLAKATVIVTWMENDMKSSSVERQVKLSSLFDKN